MRVQPLGSSGMSLSVVGFGAWAAGGPGWSQGLGPQDDRDSILAIRRACELGVNWIDTAPAYGLGHSEEVVGAALGELPAGERPFVFTKCGPAWNDQGQFERMAAPDSIRRQVEASLRRLGVEHIDLYQIHWPHPWGSALDAAWRVLADLKAEGKIRCAGVSNFSVEQLAACEALGHIDSLQPHLSAIARAAAEDVIPWSAANGTGVIVYSPMESGLLTGSFSSERVAALPDDDVRKSGRVHFAEPNLSRNLAVAEALREVAERRGVPVPAVAVAWTLAWPGVTGAIVGARHPRQVDDWAGAGSFELDDADLDSIALAIAACGAGEGPTRPARMPAGALATDATAVPGPPSS